MAMIYAVLALPVLLGMGVFAVDVGRFVVARSELQGTADAAARYAAVGMISSSTRSTTAYNQAAAVCAQSFVDGKTVTISSSNVQLGIWDTDDRTFTVVSNHALANAVRITLSYTIGGTGSMPTFAQALGMPAKTVTVNSVATASVFSTEVTAPSMGNLWLAGMPDNSTSTNLQGNAGRYDNSGTSSNTKQRPQEVSLSTLGLAAGDLVSFEGLSGQANNGGGSNSNVGPDGNTSWNVALGNSAPSVVPNNSVNGIANVRAPISACMAVFLNDNAPNTTSAPSCLDFATVAQRDYSLLAPELKQPFHVGDGKTNWGEVQHIRIPTGATRIFLGMMDAWQWNDNQGSFRLNFYRSTTVSTVD